MNSNRKAQSLLISHSLAIAMSVLLVIVIIATFSNMRNQYQKFIAENEVKQVCLSVKSAVEDIYDTVNYTSQSNSTLGMIKMELPRRIADSRYHAMFFNSSVYIGMDNMQINQTCKIGFPARFSGTSNGGNTYITWTRYANGSDEITMTSL